MRIQLGDGGGNNQYRTCSECGEDCMPEPTDSNGLGVRIVFVCPEHGAHSVVDPFEGLR